MEAAELDLVIMEEIEVVLRLLESPEVDLEMGAVLEVGDVWMVKVWEPTEAARIAV